MKNLHFVLLKSFNKNDLTIKVIRTLLDRVVHLPDREARELAEFMEKYIVTYQMGLPNFLVFHHDFTIILLYY
jgi:hypothetical protein